MAMCTTHQKNRSEMSLQDDGAGGLCCKPGMECKTGGGGGGGGKGGGGGGDTAMCSVHNKNRSFKSMMADGWGGMCCAPGFECQVGAGGGGGAAPWGPPAWGGMPSFGNGGGKKKGGGGPPDAQLTCSIHGKNRSERSMMDDGFGGHRCMDGMECKTGAEAPANIQGDTAMCSKHNKQRSANSLVDDGAGGFCCASHAQCKTGKEGGGGGGGDFGGNAWAGGNDMASMFQAFLAFKGKAKGGCMGKGNGKGKGFSPY